MEYKFKRLSYIINFPEEYENGSQYPILFHLHGAGGRGNNLSLIENEGPIKEYKKGNKNFILVAPQCYADTWFEIFEQLIEFCEYIYSQKITDKKRFYFSGISMGGYASYQLAMSRPNLFAAGIICCAGGMYWNAARLKDIPIWAFHGEQDKTVFVRDNQNMVEAINRMGGNAKLTVYPELEHNCWGNAFSTNELYEWLLKHRNK